MVSYRCQAISGFESPCLPASDFITISYAYIVLRSGWHVDCCIRCMRHLYPTVSRDLDPVSIDNEPFWVFTRVDLHGFCGYRRGLLAPGRSGVVTLVAEI